jgi:lysine N6-hydroxylase
MDKLSLVGIGIGPFNLSLAALLEKTPEIRAQFFDRKPQFDWHPEMMFNDSTMQTSYLKDLVTPVDPTSPYSFMNYLVANQIFYPFLNTQRTTISRREFEIYCQWVSRQLEDRLHFNTDVYGVQFKDDAFEVETSRGLKKTQNICVATGLTKRIPACASRVLGPKVFHAKSPELKTMDLSGKRLLIVGGGQTGIEIFRNAINEKWGRAKDIQLITRRKNLEPLDESAFANDYFTPNYANTFFDLPPDKKSVIVASQKLASDGNTPSYLFDLYRDLYRMKYVEQDTRGLNLLACRRLQSIETDGSGYRVEIENCFLDKTEVLFADIIVLSTGFESVVPKVLEPLFSRIDFDEQNRFRFNKSYSVAWNGPNANKIYALNFSRHDHGIIDPQTSLMAWRSGIVVNDLAGREIYQTEQKLPNFIEYSSPERSSL